MINKLIVLNGTEGHRFEVGKPYVLSDINQIVKEIRITGIGHKIIFEDDSYADILTTNVLLFGK